MNPFFTLALLLAAAAPTHSSGRATLPTEVNEVLSRALSVPDGRIVPIGWEAHLPAGCLLRQATVSGAITASARLPVKLYGQNCSGWGWVRFEVWAPAAQTIRPVRAGEPLQPAVVVEPREVRSGHTGIVPQPGAVAARDLPAGIVLEPAHVAGAALASGELVKIVVLRGSLVIETQGRAIACGTGRTCAVLPTGRHVEGHWQEGQLLVELP